MSGDRRTEYLSSRQYRLLAYCALALTLVALLMPGSAIDAILTLVRQWLPWTTPDVHSEQVFPADKVVHFFLFLVCAALVMLGWFRERGQWLPVYLAFLAMGIMTEVLQYYIPGRGFAVGDILANGVGAALGVVLGRRR